MLRFRLFCRLLRPLTLRNEAMLDMELRIEPVGREGERGRTRGKAGGRGERGIEGRREGERNEELREGGRERGTRN